MREILFRGKSKGKPEWVYGSLYKEGSQAFILVGGRFYPEPSNGQSVLGIMDWYEVFPDSIGQFTGLLDKNGKKIFEGDILKRTVSGIFFANQQNKELYFEVPMISELYGDRTYREDARTSVSVYGLCEVAGNIYDNPELMTAPKEATDRDYTEDEHLENGNYFHYCCICGESFLGHKRRIVCKRCSKKSEGVEDKQ